MITTTATAAPSTTTSAADQAVDAATHALLNCYLRESPSWWVSTAAGAGTQEAVVPLLRREGEVRVGIRYLSPTARHLFVLPARLSFGSGPLLPVGFTTLVALLLDELDALPADEPGAAAGSPTVLMARILDSTHDVARYLELREAEVDRLWGPGPLSFTESEQALLLGHPVHPTPKSRSEMSPAERTAFGPEAGARFRLHWFSVAADLVRHDSATGTPAPAMAARLFGDPVPEGRIVLPAHPWEAAHLPAGPGSGRPVRVRGGRRSRPGRPRRRPHHVGAHRLPPRLAVAAQVLAPRPHHQLHAGDPAQGAGASGGGGPPGRDLRGCPGGGRRPPLPARPRSRLPHRVQAGRQRDSTRR